MIIGVTGYFAAGKDTFAQLLVKRGYCHVSLSDILREEIRARRRRVTIPLLTQVGNELRAAHGPGVLAGRALERLPRDSHAVVTSIRHPAEVETLRNRPDFVMVFIDAPIRVRYERSRARARSGDPVSLEEFRAAERAQMRSRDASAQQLLACKKLADMVLRNDGSLESFERRVERLLARVTARATRCSGRCRNELKGWSSAH